MNPSQLTISVFLPDALGDMLDEQRDTARLGVLLYDEEGDEEG